jgi:hypothetical protein
MPSYITLPVGNQVAGQGETSPPLLILSHKGSIPPCPKGRATLNGECLEAGDSIDIFLYDFPTVKREQVIAVLEAAKREVLEVAPA